MPINLTVSQTVKIGGRALSFNLGGRYYAGTPEGGAEWSLQLSLNLLLPEVADSLGR